MSGVFLSQRGLFGTVMQNLYLFVPLLTTEPHQPGNQQWHHQVVVFLARKSKGDRDLVNTFP